MLTMQLLKEKFSVCRLDSNEKIPSWIGDNGFVSITRTLDELSIVCLEENVPKEITQEKDWRILQVKGPLDFSLVGILSAISTLLANNKISIFAISTYDTDYILVKDTEINNAISILSTSGYQVLT